MASDLYIEVNFTARPIESVTVNLSLKQRSTADVWLIDKGSLYNIEVGQRVEIGNSTAVLFGGTIDEKTALWYPHTTLRKWHLRCVSYEQIATRRRIVASYPRQKAGDIIKAIKNVWLVGEGLNTTSVLDGPDVGPFQFDYATVEEAFDAVAAEAGYYWDIQPGLALRFFSRTTYTAPWGVTTTSPHILHDPVSVVYDRQKVSNRVIVKVGQFIGDLQNETVTGDGSAQQFEVTQSIAAEPTVTLASVVQTVGINGVDTGKQWYWALGSNTITQDVGGTPLGVGVVLNVDYLPLNSSVATVEDAANQVARAAVEGLSGIYETVIEANTPSTRSDAVALGEAFLAAHLGESLSLEFKTLDTDLGLGMSINVNLPEVGIGSPGTPFLIESISLSSDTRTVADVYNITASGGALLETWQQVIGGSVEGSNIVNLAVPSSSDELVIGHV